MSELASLIDAVNVKLSQVRRADPYDYDDFLRRASEGARIVQELRDECGARIRLDREPATMSMGGVNTSATGGWSALLQNWVAAARKRIGAQ